MLHYDDIEKLPLTVDERALGEYQIEQQHSASSLQNNRIVKKALTARLSAMEGSRLQRMLQPIKVATFFDRYWQDDYCYQLTTDNKAYFADLLSVARLKQALVENVYQADDIRFVQGQKYCSGPGFTPESNGDVLDAAAVIQFIAAGGSVVVDDCHRYYAELNHLWHELVELFQFPITCTAYFTPAGACTFPAHWDTDDVFVLQVEGRKHWTVFEPVIRDPLEHHRWSKYERSFGSPVFEQTLEPGSLLYLPRGFPHQAIAAEDTPSLHITLGTCIPTWHRCLQSTIEQVMLEVGQKMNFRQPSSLMLQSDEDEINENYLESLRAELIDKLSLASIRHAIQNLLARQGAWGVMNTTERRESNPLPQAGEILIRSPGPFFVEETKNKAVLKFAGHLYLLPQQALTCLRAIGKMTTVCANSLPNELELAERLVLLQRLLDEGVLVRRISGKDNQPA